MISKLFLVIVVLGVASAYLKIGYGSKRVAAFIFFAAAVVTSVYLRLYYGGWLVIFYGIPTLAFLAAHIYFNTRAIFSSGAFTFNIAYSIFISNFIWLQSILLQYDAGDSSSFFIVAEILNHTGLGAERLRSLAENYFLWNTLVFLPNLLAYVDLECTRNQAS